MAINARLFEKIRKKLGLSQSSTYRKISEEADRLAQSLDVGALEVARKAGIGYRAFATQDQLDQLREGMKALQPIQTYSPPPVARAKPTTGKKKSKAKSPGKAVWIVHGRDQRLRKSMVAFAHSIGLKDYEWSTAVRATKKGAPYVGEVLDKAFARASAVIVLLTPDDEAKLKKEHWHEHDESYERTLTGQARLNVVFEAGIAMGLFPERTVFVECGNVRRFTDTGGRLVVRMNDSEAKRRELANALEAAGCEIDLSGEVWKTAGDFTPPK